MVFTSLTAFLAYILIYSIFSYFSGSKESDFRKIFSRISQTLIKWTFQRKIKICMQNGYKLHTICIHTCYIERVNQFRLKKSNAMTTETQTTVKETPIKFALDLGNFTIKALYDGKKDPLVISSVFANLGASGQTEKSTSEESPIIKSENLSVHHHYGSMAQVYGRYSALVSRDKTKLENFLPAMLASFPIINRKSSYTIDLVLSVPHRVFGDVGSNISAIKTNHKFTRNGKDMEVKVKTVKVFEEGVGTFKLAKDQHMISDKGYTLIVDVGGGTWNAMLVSSKHTTPQKIESMKDCGGITLATMIADHQVFKNRFGSTPNQLYPILEGIANGTNYYQENEDLNWADIFPVVAQEWIMNGLDNLRISFKDEWGLIRKVIFTGGNAHILQKYMRPSSFKDASIFMPESQYANVRGMLTL